ncbi:MAG TPA: hypothetical protein VN891_18965, partial [Steroidobacteraceae bacterium]|nr:hypothetical protein [Steroidobacteraceae bacterium]
MPSRTSMAALALGAIASARIVCGQVATSSGEMLFQNHCAACHNGAADSRAPAPDVLRQRSAAAI